MSSKSCKCYYKNEKTLYPMEMGNDCCCNFNLLVILILIILQFGKKDKDKKDGGQVIDNGILFIITLFYLSCCLKCK